MRSAKITKVIIHSTGSAPKTFLAIAHAFHVPVIVIRPHQCHVVRYRKSGIIDIECFFIWYEYLRNIPYIFPFMLCKNIPLRIEYLFKSPCPDGRVFGTFHRFIMQPSHADGIDIVVSGSLPEPIIKFL